MQIVYTVRSEHNRTLRPEDHFAIQSTSCQHIGYCEKRPGHVYLDIHSESSLSNLH
jgi:hypothetical protein